MKIQAPQPSIDFGTLELLPLGVVIVDADGQVLFYNHREEEISGLSRKDVVGRNFFLDVAPCTDVREFHGRFKEIMDQGLDPVEFEFTFPFALAPRQVKITLHPFLKDGGYLCIIFVADLTERELLRERILQGQRFSELGEVAAKVAHNFNNLLFIVQMCSEAALDEATPGMRVHLERSLRAIGDGTTLVRRCLEVARTGTSLTRNRLDLNGAIRTAAAFASPFADLAAKEEGREVTFRMNLLPEPLAVLGDEGELREALLNLFRNAIDAIPGKGVVRVLSSREGGSAVVDIIDDGTGMDPEVLRHIFTPMFTTKGDRGTGLGLASVHSTLRRHGGSIRVDSSPGVGSHFRITLPEA